MTITLEPDTECLLGVKAPTMGEIVGSTSPVPKQAINLADLYRKGKKRGLLPARSHYQ